jgi:HSP20 family protein
MTNLAKREHEFNDLFDLRHTFDRFFNRALNHSSSSEESSERLILAVPPIEAWVDQDKREYHLSIAVPGIDPIELNVQGRDLTISGEHQTSNEKKDANYLDQEFSYARFARTITLPEGVEPDKVRAEYKNGVLEVTAPIKESALPKRIEIKSESTEQKQLKDTKDAKETKAKGGNA